MGSEAGAWHQGQTVSEIMSMATRFAAMAATEATAEAGRGGRVLSFGGQPVRGGVGSTETCEIET